MAGGSGGLSGAKIGGTRSPSALAHERSSSVLPLRSRWSACFHVASATGAKSAKSLSSMGLHDLDEVTERRVIARSGVHEEDRRAREPGRGAASMMRKPRALRSSKAAWTSLTR